MLDRHDPSTVDREMVLIKDIFEQMEEGVISTDSDISPYIHTPKELCQEKLDKVVENKGGLSGNILVLNPEYLILLLSDHYNTTDSTIYFYTDDVYMEKVVEGILSEHPSTQHVNIVVDDTPVDDILGCFFEGNSQDNLTNRDVKMQFDHIVGNPPYQKRDRPSGGVGASHTLWDDFFNKSFNLLKKGGYLSLVHPSLWRKPNHEILEIILSNNLKYLNIFDEDDGIKIFNAETRFDWYVLEKNYYESVTEIIDQKGSKTKIDLSNWNFIPNYAFDLINSLLAENEKNTVDLIHSWTAYETRNSYMSKEKTDEYKYPVIYTVPKDCNPNLYWSSTNENGHFGVPKVVFSTGRPISVGIFKDFNGDYGLSQFATGITADSKEELEKIAKALDSKKFRKFCSAISVGKLEMNSKVISMFKKDFWKEFI